MGDRDDFETDMSGSVGRRPGPSALRYERTETGARRATARRWTLLASLVAVSACGSSPAPPSAGGDGTGSVELALMSTAGSTTYFLQHAVFDVSGPSGGANLSSDVGAPDEQVLTAMLPVGRYQVTLRDGWQLVRRDIIDGGSKEQPNTALVPVQATLLSPNPVTISVFSAQTTTVTFQFQSNGIPLTFGPGAIDIGLQTSTCDAAPPPGVELNVIANSNFEVDTAGWTTERGEPQITRSTTAHCGFHSGVGVPLDGAGPGAMYQLPNPVINTTYAVSGWFRHSEPSDTTVFMNLITSPDASSGCPTIGFLAIASQTVSPDTWTRISGTVSVGSSCVASASLFVLLDKTDGAALLIDDVFAIPQ